jgi:hypothetical protein
MILRQYNWIQEEGHRVPDPRWRRLTNALATGAVAGLLVAAVVLMYGWAVG